MYLPLVEMELRPFYKVLREDSYLFLTTLKVMFEADDPFRNLYIDLLE